MRALPGGRRPDRSKPAAIRPVLSQPLTIAWQASITPDPSTPHHTFTRAIDPNWQGSVRSRIHYAPTPHAAALAHAGFRAPQRRRSTPSALDRNGLGADRPLVPQRQPGAAQITLARYTHALPENIESTRQQLADHLAAGHARTAAR